MRTEAEVREALDLLGWYTRTGGLDRQIRRGDAATAHNLEGTAMTLMWLLHEDNEPLTGTLADLRAARRRAPGEG